ncbi:MAG TPA: 4-hydroxythreonine-4-phosphate dehydrogenase PdxA [Chloroflexota bacterium]
MREPTRGNGAATDSLPRIAIGMGDPAGVGPEIVVKALSDPDVYGVCVPVVIGDARVLAAAPGWRGGENRIVRVSDVEEARPEPGVIHLIDLANVPATVKRAVASAEGGQASIDYLDRGIELARAGKVEAIVYAPFNKEAIKKAGHHFTDEYEYMADLLGSRDYTVLMVGPRFTLASVTLHVPMKEMPALLTKERILNTIRLSNAAAMAAGVARPKIGVAALNPHAGEGATLGTEERDAISPAVQAAKKEGIDARGPYPADTFFMTARDSTYDVYVGMYHDQGRIAIKLLDFGRVTTMAEGLPVLFCTVGHGSAYDIAGKGIARHENLKDTITLAARRALSRRAER